MSSAQTWTVVGLFAASLFALVGLVLAVVRAELQGLRNELVARLEALDRDVQRLFVHVFAGEKEE